METDILSVHSPHFEEVYSVIKQFMNMKIVFGYSSDASMIITSENICPKEYKELKHEKFVRKSVSNLKVGVFFLTGAIIFFIYLLFSFNFMLSDIYSDYLLFSVSNSRLILRPRVLFSIAILSKRNKYLKLFELFFPIDDRLSIFISFRQFFPLKLERIDQQIHGSIIKMDDVCEPIPVEAIMSFHDSGRQKLIVKTAVGELELKRKKRIWNHFSISEFYVYLLEIFHSIFYVSTESELFQNIIETKDKIAANGVIYSVLRNGIISNLVLSSSLPEEGTKLLKFAEDNLQSHSFGFRRESFVSGFDRIWGSTATIGFNTYCLAFVGNDFSIINSGIEKNFLCNYLMSVSSLHTHIFDEEKKSKMVFFKELFVNDLKSFCFGKYSTVKRIFEFANLFDCIFFNKDKYLIEKSLNQIPFSAKCIDDIINEEIGNDDYDAITNLNHTSLCYNACIVHKIMDPKYLGGIIIPISGEPFNHIDPTSIVVQEISHIFVAILSIPYHDIMWKMASQSLIDMLSICSLHSFSRFCDSENFKKLTESVLYIESGFPCNACIELDFFINNVLITVDITLNRLTSSALSVIIQPVEHDQTNLFEIQKYSDTLKLAFQYAGVSLWYYQHEIHPQRVFSSHPVPFGNNFANISTVKYHVVKEYQEPLLKIFEDSIQTHKSFNVEIPVVFESLKWFSFRGVTFGEDNQIVLMNIDISQLKDAEEQIRVEKKRAEDAFASKSRFLANISHEIRNPLNGISGLIELLCNNEIYDSFRECMDLLIDSFTHINDLLNDTLDLAKIEQNRMSVYSIRFEPLSIMSEISSRWIEVSEKKGVVLRSRTSPSLPIAYKGDPHILNRVLNNVLSNAFKFTDQGSVLIRMKETKDGFLLITVKDTGVGIKEGDKARLFTEFYTRDYMRERPRGGIGLGLLVAKKMLGLVNGIISIKNNRNMGSSCKIHLPYESLYLPYVPLSLREKKYQVLVLFEAAPFIEYLLPHTNYYGLCVIQNSDMINDNLVLVILTNSDDYVKRGLILKEKHPNALFLLVCKKDNVLYHPSFETVVKPLPLTLFPRLFSTVVWRKKHQDGFLQDSNYIPKGFNVLYADDSEINQLIMRKVFEKLGVFHQIVNNGIEVLKSLANSKFNALILDHHMPLLDGPSTSKAIRFSKAPYSKIPIASLTASVSKEDEIECLNAGMNLFTSKPITFVKIRKLLQDLSSFGDKLL